MRYFLEGVQVSKPAFDSKRSADPEYTDWKTEAVWQKDKAYTDPLRKPE